MPNELRFSQLTSVVILRCDAECASSPFRLHPHFTAIGPCFVIECSAPEFQFRTLIMQCRPYISMTNRAHDRGEVSRARQDPNRSYVGASTRRTLLEVPSHCLLAGTSCRLRSDDRMQIPLEGNIPTTIRPRGAAAFLQYVKIQWLMGTSHRPSGVLLSDTTIVRLFHFRTTGYGIAMTSCCTRVRIILAGILPKRETAHLRSRSVSEDLEANRRHELENDF